MPLCVVVILAVAIRSGVPFAPILPLPLVSYGGSFLLCCLISLGLVQAVHIQYRLAADRTVKLFRTDRLPSSTPGHFPCDITDPAAVTDAEANLARLGAHHVTAVRESAEDFAPRLAALRPDAIVLDPPRAGCAAVVLMVQEKD